MVFVLFFLTLHVTIFVNWQLCYLYLAKFNFLSVQSFYFTFSLILLLNARRSDTLWPSLISLFKQFRTFHSTLSLPVPQWLPAFFYEPYSIFLMHGLLCFRLGIVATQKELCCSTFLEISPWPHSAQSCQAVICYGDSERDRGLDF